MALVSENAALSAISIRSEEIDQIRRRLRQRLAPERLGERGHRF